MYKKTSTLTELTEAELSAIGISACDTSYAFNNFNFVTSQAVAVSINGDAIIALIGSNSISIGESNSKSV